MADEVAASKDTDPLLVGERCMFVVDIYSLECS